MEVYTYTEEDGKSWKIWSPEAADSCCKANVVKLGDIMCTWVDPVITLRQGYPNKERTVEIQASRACLDVLWDDVTSRLTEKIHGDFANTFFGTPTFDISKLRHVCRLHFASFRSVRLVASPQPLPPLNLGPRNLTQVRFHNCFISQEALLCIAEMCTVNPVESLTLEMPRVYKANESTWLGDADAQQWLAAVRSTLAHATCLERITQKTPHHGEALLSLFRHCCNLRFVKADVTFCEGLGAELARRCKPLQEVAILTEAWTDEEMGAFIRATGASGKIGVVRVDIARIEEATANALCDVMAANGTPFSFRYASFRGKATVAMRVLQASLTCTNMPFWTDWTFAHSDWKKACDLFASPHEWRNPEDFFKGKHGTHYVADRVILSSEFDEHPRALIDGRSGRGLADALALVPGDTRWIAISNVDLSLGLSDCIMMRLERATRLAFIHCLF